MTPALAEINRKALETASRIKLLSSVSWLRSPETEAALLTALQQGHTLPELEFPRRNYSEELRQLGLLHRSFKAEEPLELVTRANIESYMDAAHMAGAVGTSALTELSVNSFGSPSDPVPGTSLTNLSVAERLLAVGHPFEHPYIESLPEDTAAHEVAAEIESLMARHAARHAPLGNKGPQHSPRARTLPLRVLLVEGLAAKATATSEVIRLRSGCYFNRHDAKQLFAHEVMVHALTARNGLAQPVLCSMGRGAPRTTATQEGLATFSELVTGSMDLKRLMRLALRTIAIERALRGADFRETFQFFMAHDQGPLESLYSTLRIFRGSQARAPAAVFTKDVVYLAGLMRVHALFRWALANRRIGIVHLLFCGRVAIEDCFLLEGALEQGHIARPLDLPEWYENIEGLAGQLTFSLIASLCNEARVWPLGDLSPKDHGPPPSSPPPTA